MTEAVEGEAVMKVLSLLICLVLVNMIFTDSIVASKNGHPTDNNNITQLIDKYQKDMVALYDKIVGEIDGINSLQKSGELSDKDKGYCTFAIARGFYTLCSIHSLLSKNTLHQAAIYANNNDCAMSTQDSETQKRIVMSLQSEADLLGAFINYAQNDNLKENIKTLKSDMETISARSSHMIILLDNTQGEKIARDNTFFYDEMKSNLEEFQRSVESALMSIDTYMTHIDATNDSYRLTREDFVDSDVVVTMTKSYEITLQGLVYLCGAYDISRSGKTELPEDLKKEQIIRYIKKLCSRLDFIHGQAANYSSDISSQNVQNECHKIMMAIDETESRLKKITVEMQK